MKKLLIMLFLSAFSYQTYSQEVFFDKSLALFSDPPNHFYIYLQGSTLEKYADFITKSDNFKLSYNNESAILYKLGRGYHANSAIAFKNEDALFKLPAAVTQEFINKNNGFTISGWFKIDDLKQDRALAYIGSSTEAKIDIFIRNHYIVVRKRSHIDSSKILPVIDNSFPLEYKTFIPKSEDITNGYFYFALASDKSSTRIYLSRPGGRLYSQWYFFSLLDVIKPSDEIVFGRSPNIYSNYKLVNGYSNIMVYNKSLSSDQALNAFYLQSPLYPGVSYRFKNQAGKELMPTKSNNTSSPINENGYYQWKSALSTSYYSALSSNRWFITTLDKEKALYIPVNLKNARTGGYIYQKTSSNYYYQLLHPAENYSDRTTFFMEKLEDKPAALYRIDQNNHIRFWSKHSPSYWLGSYNDYLYLDDNNDNGRWNIIAADKVYHGAEREPAPKGSVVRLRNLGDIPLTSNGRRFYLNLYSGSSYYYAKLDKYDINHPDISAVQPFILTQQNTTNYGVDVKYHLDTFNNRGKLQSYYGATDTTEDDYVISYKNDYYWELVAIKDPWLPKEKFGDRTYYALRTSNGYGTFLLGQKESYCPGGASICYVLKSSIDAYDATGTPYPQFLWVIDYNNNNK